MDDRDIHHLRQIILDEGCSASRRLSSLDVLASSVNVWQTKKVHTDATCNPSERMRRFLRQALRRLLKSDGFKAPAHASAIRARLLFMKGTTIGSHLYRNKTTGTTTAATAKQAPTQSTTLSGIHAVLAQYEQAKQEVRSEDAKY